jgi:hypothetical protein
VVVAAEVESLLLPRFLENRPDRLLLEEAAHLSLEAGAFDVLAVGGRPGVDSINQFRP